MNVVIFTCPIKGGRRMYRVINNDCIRTIPRFDNGKFDLVVTSIPYNVDLGNNKFKKHGYDLYQDNLDHEKYISWLKSVFLLLKPKIKAGGRVVINIGDGKNGAVPTHSDIIQFMTNDLGYLIKTTIIWNKHQIGNRTAWGSWKSPSNPSFPTPFEYILVFAKDSQKLQEKGETDLEGEEFTKWAYALWEFSPETKAKSLGHPAPFPVELPYRLIKMLSWKDAVILDPFMGVGTTGVACVLLDRLFYGIDISKEYCETAEKRIKEVINNK